LTSCNFLLKKIRAVENTYKKQIPDWIISIVRSHPSLREIVLDMKAQRSVTQVYKVMKAQKIGDAEDVDDKN
jgi:mannosyltransferase OCH1-like enzyme